MIEKEPAEEFPENLSGGFARQPACPPGWAVSLQREQKESPMVLIACKVLMAPAYQAPFQESQGPAGLREAEVLRLQTDRVRERALLTALHCGRSVDARCPGETTAVISPDLKKQAGSPTRQPTRDHTASHSIQGDT